MTSEGRVVIPVVPLPASITTAGGELRLVDRCTVSVDDPRLGGLAARFVDDVAADTGLRLEIVDRPGDIRLTLDATAPSDAPAVVGVSPHGGEPVDERHRLIVTPSHATIAAASVEGVFRGLTTLRQLISAGRSGAGFAVLALEVDDGPRYAWRGLSLDVVRSFHGPAQVRRVIDIMALHKLNVLHLHLTDDQGWRIEIPGWPALTTVGAAGAVGDRPGGHYSHDDFAGIVRHAAERHITVVPEIDVPGHSGAAIMAYPELGMSPTALDPDQPRVLRFLDDVIGVMADLTPGPWLHIGGDEAFGMTPDGYGRLVDHARRAVIDAGKRPVLWQESARSSTAPTDLVQYWMAFDPAIEDLLLADDFDPQAPPAGVTMPPEVLAHVAAMLRAGQTDVARALARGARILLSPARHVYLDRPYAEPPAGPGQADMQRRLGLRVYPRWTVEQSFDWDPAASIDAGPDSVAGIEAAMWCETVTTGDELEFMLLPRLAGVAERAWSPAPGARWPEYRDRLAPQARLWSTRGWTFFSSSLVDW
jgi:hexosaminidase